jgi:hypothetical protein
VAFASPYPDIEIPDVSVPDFILGANAERPDAVALVDGARGDQLTYGQLTAYVDRVAAAIERHGASVRDDDVADLRSMVEGFAGSALRERIAASRRVRTELPFAFTLTPADGGGRSLLVNGVVDVHAAEGDATLIVDYKSDPLNGDDPRAVAREKYGTQRLVYALAGLRAGAERVEVTHLFLERPGEPVVAAFEPGQADELERELLGVARGVVQPSFEPTHHPHRELCFGCPAQPALCTWGPERTLADA